MSAYQVLRIFLRLGLTSFGGPVAHLGYFRREFVQRQGWLDDETFAEIVALAQLLPGPSSSQVGIVVGYARAGVAGALAAWCGFTLPSAIALVAFAYGVRTVAGAGWERFLHGLLVAAVAIVASAVWTMARTLTPDLRRRSLAAAVAGGALLAPPSGLAQLALIVLGAVFGALFLRSPRPPQTAQRRGFPAGNANAALAAAATFAGLVLGLPFAVRLNPSGPLLAFAKFFEVGGLVFGGGHVVLPLLAAQVVTPGWISERSFLAGYGAAQAVPGPLFTFAAYLGAAFDRGPVHGVAGAALALTAIYLPSFLLIAAILPVWQRLRANSPAEAALRGVNAAVVGILAAALYAPVWVTAIRSGRDVALAAAALLALAVWRAPPFAVVLGTALVAVL